MSSPAPVASRQYWNDVVNAIEETVIDIHDLREEIAQRRTDIEGDPVTDPTDADRDAEIIERERRTRLDYETDGDLDGDYDPDPTDERDLDA